MKEASKLTKIRYLMGEYGISGYIVPHGDAHNVICDRIISHIE